MAITISPIQPNQVVTAALWQGMNRAARNQSWRVSGLGVAGSLSALEAAITQGEAVVDGVYVDHDLEIIAIADNETNRIWLQKDGTVYYNNSDTPADSTDLFLGSVITSGGVSTGVEPNEELDISLGVEVEVQQKSFAGILNLAGGNSATICATLSVQPGLYWVTARIPGQGASVLKNSGIEVTCTTAANASAVLMISSMGNGAGLVGSGTRKQFSHTSTELYHFYRIAGMCEFADAGEIQVELDTGINVEFLSGGYLTATKIA